MSSIAWPRAGVLVLTLTAVSLCAATPPARPRPPAPEGTREVCVLSFDRNPARPARVQNNALPCLARAAEFLRRNADRKLVLVGVKNPARDHEPFFVDPSREAEDASGYAVRLEDLSAYRAVNSKWYLVHFLHSEAARILPTTDESYFAQTVTVYDVPALADFNHNFLNTTKINESPCTIRPCFPPDEETLQAQPRSRIVPGEPEDTGSSPAELRALASQRRHAATHHGMSGDPQTLTPLPPRPTPERPATASILPR